MLISIEIKNPTLIDTESGLEITGVIPTIPWLEPAYNEQIYSAIIQDDIAPRYENPTASKIKEKEVRENTKDKDINVANVKYIKINNELFDPNSFSRMTINSATKQAKIDIPSHNAEMFPVNLVVDLVFELS